MVDNTISNNERIRTMKYFIYKIDARSGTTLDCELLEFKNDMQAHAYCMVRDSNSRSKYAFTYELMSANELFEDQYSDYPNGRRLDW